MTMRCPRCGTEIREGDTFCGRCGLDLTPLATGARPPVFDRSAHAPAPLQAQDGISLHGSGVERGASSHVSGSSIVKALTPAVPAKGVFWVGLGLLLLGFGLAACQVLFVLALEVSAGGQQSQSGLIYGFGLSSCVMFVLALIGFFLIAVGRPKTTA